MQHLSAVDSSLMLTCFVVLNSFSESYNAVRLHKLARLLKSTAKINVTLTSLNAEEGVTRCQV